jgi:tetratricopeptide (TPR) repeat protein
MTLETETDRSVKRRLILRDALTFLSLALITAVLFAVTLFLFHTFAAHREELAQRWAARGQAAIASGRPDQAIVALRTALSYAPGERSYELLLAQALADAGHTEEAYNYFLGLWETQPGDGFINLRLARLAAKKNDMEDAINHYRAAIYGTWEGDGIVRRREARLELARYLIAHHDLSSARTELLIAGGNAPDDAGLALTLAQLLEQASAPSDALNYYQKVLVREPNNQQALEAAGRLEYGFGNFEEAHRLLERAVREHDATASGDGTPSPDIQSMLDTSAKVLSLAPSKKLPAKERVTRILRARNLAKKRFDSCDAQVSAASGLPSPLQTLGARWKSKEATIDRAALLNDPSEQDAVMKLVYDTELQTNPICGAPTGDDALLLMLAKSPKTVEP